MKILITGITGNIGGKVYQSLLQHSYTVELVGGCYAVPEKPWEGVTMKRLDFMDPSTFEDALDGVDVVFFMRPPAIADVPKYMVPFIDAMKLKQVKQVVFLSLQGVENNTFTPHHKIEKYILSVGLPYTFLRPSFFMENLTSTHRQEIIDLSEIIVPAGTGKCNFIAGDDIAEVARLALIDEKYRNQALELTGKQAYSYSDIAQILSDELGKEIRYTNPSILRFIQHRRSMGDKWAFILVMIALYSITR